MIAVFDSNALEELTDGMAAEDYTLSPKTVYLAILAISCCMQEQHNWVTDGIKITDVVWDDLSGQVVNAAIAELFTPN